MESTMRQAQAFRTNKLTVVVMGALAIMVQGSIARADDTPAAPVRLEKIEVTGSSIKRTIEDETALPVQIITRQEISRSGVQNTEDLLRTISATSAAQGTQMSNGSGATTSGASTVSLRGLGAQRTLVLINGRRSSVFGGVPGSSAGDDAVDINSIPIAAIERIEVLKDGASAIYGSDAVAGVINFILRDNLQGGEVSATFGATRDGGGRQSKFNGIIGIGDVNKDRYNVVLGVNAQKETAIYGSQRPFASTAILTDSLGGVNDTASSNTFPGNVVNSGGSSRNPLAPNNCAPSRIDPNLPSNRCMFDPAPYVALLPETRKLSLFGSGNYALGEDTKAYGQAAYSRNKTDYTIQPSPISHIFSEPVSGPYTTFLNNYIAAHPGLNTAYGSTLASFQPGTFSTPLTLFLPPSSPYYQQAISALTPAEQATFLSSNSPIAVKFRSFINGLRSLEDVSDSMRLVGGIKGFELGWDYDVGVLYNANKVTESPTNGYFSQSGFAELFSTGVINPFGPSPADVVSQVRALNFNGTAFESKTSLTELNAKASRTIYTLPAGDVALAAGGSLRQDKFKFTASSAIQTGDISGYGGNFSDVDKSRSVEAAFAELEIPVTSQVTGNLATRFENYEGVGSTTTPKAALRWQPEKNLLFRTSYGKGFRAPSLTDLYAPATQGVSAVLQNGDPLRCGVNANLPECQGSLQVITHNGGNPDLKPEKSENFTLGVVWQPDRDSQVSLDYYKVRLTNAIAIGGLGATTVLSSPQYAVTYAKYITRGAPDGNGAYGPIQYIDQTNQNLFNQVTDGLDLDMHWRFLANEVGRWTAGLTGTYVHQFDIQQPDGTYLSIVDNNYNGNTLNGSVINFVSRWRYTATLNWDTSIWSTTLAYNYQHGYMDAGGANYGDPVDANGNQLIPHVSAYHTMDVQTNFSGIPNWVLTAGARNMFNTYPPYSNAAGFFQTGYDPSYGDPRGRFLYATVTYKFK
jgi:iron complex outermembrane receptor protein